jgi:tungstate transport system ATP-binding protein
VPSPALPLFRLRDIEIRYAATIPSRSAARSGPDFACLSLELAASPTVFLVGPNGSGKSTFLKLLDGLIRPSAGSLEYLGPVPAQGRRSAYLHQHPYLLAGTVGYNAAYACLAAGFSAPESHRRAAQALASLGLEGFESRRHRRLSGGEAQRVALARIIASEAPVLLLDEPTASADAESARLIGLALAALSAAGRSLVISTHDPSFIDDFSAGNTPGSAPSGAHRVLTFSHGRIVADRIHADRMH